MKKSLTKKLLLCIMAAVTVSASVYAGVSLGNSQTVLADTAAIIFESLKTSYSAGEKMEIPDTAKINYNGELLAVEKSYVVKPDGNALVGKTFDLDAIGEYTLVFESTKDGKKVSAKQTFKVLKQFYTVTGDSTVYYGDLNAQFAKEGMEKGIVAELAEGATLSFAEPINVIGKPGERHNLFTFNLVRADAAVNYLSIRIVDCYDPEIELDIQYWRRINQETYLNAGPKGGGLVGLSENTSGQYAIGDRVYSRGIFGAVPTGAWDHGNGKITYNNITISLEYTEDGKIRIWSRTPDVSREYQLVTEINNDKLYGTTFPGFTTGEAMLSITATGFSGVSTARVEFGDIQGKRNDDLNTFGEYVESKKPDIVPANQTDVKIVAGIETKVPEAIAYDASGLKRAVDYTVWYNYASPSTRRTIAVKNGKFTPTSLGTYTIEYRAEDVYGNKQTKLLDLIAVKTATSGISIDVDEVESANIGSEVDLSKYTVNSLCQNPTVAVTVTAPSGRVADITKSASNYSINEIGDYKVKYTYSDAFYSGEYEYAITSVFGGKAIFEKNAVPVPEYFIAGATYSVEDVKAYTYSGSNKQAVELKAYASYDGGAYEAISQEEFTVRNAGTLKIKLVTKDDETIAIESSTAKIVDVGYGTANFDVAKYFVGDFTGVAQSGSSTFTATKGGNPSMKFINPLLLSKFSFAFKVDKDASVLGLDLIFTDYYDRTKTAVIALNEGDGEAKNATIKGISSLLTASWKGKETAISYDGGKVEIDGVPTAVDFGFTSDLALFEVRARSATTGFALNVLSVCNQPFGKQWSDEASPLISAELPAILALINEEFVTGIPQVADVLSPSAKKNCLLTVTFTKFNETSPSTHKDVTGKTLSNVSANVNYTVKFSEYGCYVFTYNYTDGAGRRGRLQQLVYVYDLVAPTIEFKQKPNATIGVAVGSQITPLEVVVRDNLTKTEDLEIWAVVYDARGRFISATTEGTFVLKEKGTYTVYIHCKDENGNAANVKYEVYAG